MHTYEDAIHDYAVALHDQVAMLTPRSPEEQTRIKAILRRRLFDAAGDATVIIARDIGNQMQLTQYNQQVETRHDRLENVLSSGWSKVIQNWKAGM
jgi:hypothetical protein